MFYRINNFLSFEVHKKEQNLSTEFSTLNSQLLTRSQSDYDYFGARYYDSDLGRWMTVDPLMDKYPGWSPYNYTYNNPLKYIDPNGMEIWVNTGMIDENGKEIIYEYKNGKYYHNNEEVQKNTGWFTNPYSGFAQTVFNALQELERSKMGLEIIAKLTEESSADYTINELGGLIGSNIKGNDIYWNPADAWAMGENDNLITSPGFINLGHELAHGYLIENGILNEGVWFWEGDNSYSTHEIPATQIENKIRKELNFDRRAWYYFRKTVSILGIQKFHTNGKIPEGGYEQ